ncbi:MAG: ABC transporter permease [Limisphaerales bacterium]
MFRFILRRALETIPVLLAVATMTFFMLRLAPGGPFDSDREAPPSVQKKLDEYYGFDKPLYQQYFIQMGHLLHGDLGFSFKYQNRTVNGVIKEAAPISLELGIYSLCIALMIGLSAGIIASLKPNTLTDYIPSSLSMVGICLPTFLMGPILILIFVLHFEWFEMRWNGDDNSLRTQFRHKFLPALTLGLYYAAYVARLARGGMREVLNQDFIRTARSKGATERRVILKHAIKGGIIPVVSFLGPATAGLIAGSFVIETIFDIPGLGKFFVNSAFDRDYTMVMGVVLFYASLIILLNLVSDIVLVWLNPKLKFDE